MSNSNGHPQHTFELVALPHLNAVYHFAYNLTGNTEDAQDLLQETYLKAYRFFGSFQPGTNCKAWLFQIAKNTFINRYRKQAREPDKVSYDAVEEFYDTLKPSDGASNNLDVTLFQGLLDDDISAALASLPEQFRMVLVLSDLEDLTYEEIADIVDCPIGTVRSRLHRARKLLREKLYLYARQYGIKTNIQTDEQAGTHATHDDGDSTPAAQPKQASSSHAQTQPRA
jgi:RNA polymerase sigma-70 factor (ECF subfamily)